MKTLCFILFLASTVVTIGFVSTNKKDGFPVYENLFFIIDVEQKLLTQTVRRIILLLFNGISLLNYRIAAYTTNGVFKRIVDFQSRECLMNDITSKLRSNRTLTRRRTLLKALNERDQFFSTVTNAFIAITDDDLVSKKFDYVIRIPDDVVVEEGLIKPEKLKTFHFFKAAVKECDQSLHSLKSTNQPIYDECSRECQCINGKLVNCYRVRTQFSKLTLDQRRYYIKAYKTLFYNAVYKTEWLRLLEIHPQLKFKKLHGKKQILPFHRKYLLAIENLFRLIDCRITIPYWHFPLFSNTIYQPAPGYHIWDNDGGFGSTDTEITNGFCVSKGQFAYPAWKLPRGGWKFMKNETFVKWVCNNKYGYSRWQESLCRMTFSRTFNRQCLSRSVNKDEHFQTITYEETKDLIENTTTDKFDDFLHKIILQVHSPVHDKLGGIFCTGLSSYAPEFFPFHSMLDALWDRWQRKGKSYQEMMIHDNKTLLLWFKERRNKYCDNTNLGECGVKVKYTEIFVN